MSKIGRWGEAIRGWVKRWTDGLDIDEERHSRNPPPPPIPLPPLTPRASEPGGAAGGVRHLQLAIDLGTSSCAVAIRLNSEATRLAVLSVGIESPYASRKTIGSAIYVCDDDRIMMDDLWISQYRTAANAHRGVTYRSIKRLLFEHFHLTRPRRERLTRHLVHLYEELLWLALDPSQSSTVSLLDEAQVFGPQVDAWTHNGGLPGLTDDDERSVREIAQTDGFDVCISVPNSLMPNEVDVLVGAAARAAATVLKKLRGDETFDAYTPQVLTIREAEAVAWALPAHDRDLRGNVVILDVGAGTTDAALVTYALPRRGIETHLVEYRTGSPFGGDDLDVLLACEGWTASTKAAPTLGTTFANPLSLPGDQKNNLLQSIRAEKERWVLEHGDARFAVGVSLPDLGPDLAVQEDVNALVPVPVTGAGTARSMTVVNPHGTDAYKAFLRYTVFLSCAALLRRLERQTVSAIILTGQSSLALGMRQYVEALATHYGITAGSIRHLDEKHSEVMKTVCAEGAALYAFEAATATDTFGDVVPETFVLKERDEPMELFAAGLRVQGHQANAFVVVALPNAARHVFRYYCSPDDLLRKDLTLDWARKPIGTISGDIDRLALAFRLDLRKERIDVWTLNTKGEMVKIQYVQAPNLREGEPPHPFLAMGEKSLPLTWQSTD